MMLKTNNNFNNEIRHSSHDFANRPRWTSAHLKNRTRSSRDTSLYCKIAGWSLIAFILLSSFSYLTFVPEQVYAEYDWETKTISDIITMQEMNAKICENSSINDTKQLEDTREPGKKYWVTKLADENCWMTQNLDYDGGGTKQQDLTKWNGTGVTNATAAYYDPGSYYYNGPSSNHAQGTRCTNTTGLDACNQFSSTGSDQHYHVGNYYSWSAVTNGIDGIIASGEAPNSICPSGWKLPTSNNTDKDSFVYLLTQYGVQSSLTSGSYAMYNTPLYFVYGGSLYNGQLHYAAYDGYYWSSTPFSGADYAYLLYFNSGVVPSVFNDRYLGMSVRCLADPANYPKLLDDDQANISITVSPVISIDVTKHADDMTVDFTQVAESSIVARVGSNQPYQVLFSTDKSNLTNTNTEQSIPMITADQKIVKGTSSWGIKKLPSLTDTNVDENTIYSPVGIGDEKVLFYTSASAASEDLTFPVAIAVDSTLPSGKYSTQVTLTAVAM